MSKFRVPRTRLLVAALFLAFLTTPSAASNLIKTINDHMGISRPSGCPSRWCACYMDLALEQAGFQPRGSNLARDFASYGKQAKPASVGSIMVMSHHVGVVAGSCKNGGVLLLSGNYSHRVGQGCYNPNQAIAWRAPVR